ncbi:MAG: terminase gpP N-terminus-related DNA-binding protein [Flavipsychrobacter sp.]
MASHCRIPSYCHINKLLINTMKPNQNIQARELYMQGGLTQQEIAEILNVNRKTVGLWIQQGQWRQLRIAAQQSPAMLLQDFYNQLAVLNETIHQKGGIPTVEESVVQRRLIMNIQSFKQQPVSNYMQIYTELIDHISKQDPALSKTIATHADALVRQKTSKKRLYIAQDMFLTDEIEDEDIDDNILSHIPPHCHIEPGPWEENATFCDIPQNTNTVDSSDIPQQEPPKETEIKNPADETKANHPNYVPALSNGIIWLGNGYVYDPAISKKREITFYELVQFKNLTPPPNDVNAC